MFVCMAIRLENPAGYLLLVLLRERTFSPRSWDCYRKIAHAVGVHQTDGKEQKLQNCTRSYWLHRCSNVHRAKSDSQDSSSKLFCTPFCTLQRNHVSNAPIRANAILSPRRMTRHFLVRALALPVSQMLSLVPTYMCRVENTVLLLIYLFSSLSISEFIHLSCTYIHKSSGHFLKFLYMSFSVSSTSHRYSISLSCLASRSTRHRAFPCSLGRVNRDKVGKL